MIENSLLKAIEICGGQTALAEKIGKGQTLVSSWVNRRDCRVGADYVIQVAKATDWQVTPHDLRPDLYPNAEDGLPRTYDENHDSSLGRRSNDRRHRTVIINNSPEKPDSSA